MNDHNPKRYRELSVPKESPEKANADLTAFFDELRELRIKHGIPDVLVTAAVNVTYQGGGEGLAIIWCHFGSQTMLPTMAAFTHGEVMADQRAMIAKLLAAQREKIHE